MSHEEAAQAAQSEQTCSSRVVILPTDPDEALAIVLQHLQQTPPTDGSPRSRNTDSPEAFHRRVIEGKRYTLHDQLDEVPERAYLIPFSEVRDVIHDAESIDAATLAQFHRAHAEALQDPESFFGGIVNNGQLSLKAFRTSYNFFAAAHRAHQNGESAAFVSSGSVLDAKEIVENPPRRFFFGRSASPEEINSTMQGEIRRQAEEKQDEH